MTAEQIYTLIEKNGLQLLLLRDSATNKLCEIDEPTADAAIDELKSIVPHFKEYGKIDILGKTDKNTNWSNAFRWRLEYESKEDKKEKSVSGHSSQGIDAFTYISMMEKNMKEMGELRYKMMELQLKKDKQDPEKWAGIAREFLPYFINPGAGASNIRGPQKALVLGDISKEEIEKATSDINTELETFSKQIHPMQMKNFISELNKVPDLRDNIDKLTTLISAISKNPNLLNVALAYIKSE